MEYWNDRYDGENGLGPFSTSSMCSCTYISSGRRRQNIVIAHFDLPWNPGHTSFSRETDYIGAARPLSFRRRNELIYANYNVVRCLCTAPEGCPQKRRYRQIVAARTTILYANQKPSILRYIICSVYC